MDSASRKRHFRGWILRILGYQRHKDSGKVSHELLQTALEQVGHRTPAAVLLAELDYLAEKGYLEQTEPKKDDPFQLHLVELTAKGVDLLDGSITDVGIEVGP